LSRPPLPEDLEVFIESYDPQGRATYISGYFEFSSSRLNFNGIMMDEYGGPNIAAVLPEETQEALKKMGLDNDAMDSLITALQRKIMEGGAHVQLRERTHESVHEQSKQHNSASACRFVLWQTAIWTFLQIDGNLGHTIPAELLSRLGLHRSRFRPPDTCKEHYYSSNKNRETEARDTHWYIQVCNN
jgi:hypothetical protein